MAHGSIRENWIIFYVDIVFAVIGKITVSVSNVFTRFMFTLASCHYLFRKLFRRFFFLFVFYRVCGIVKISKRNWRNKMEVGRKIDSIIEHDRNDK